MTKRGGNLLLKPLCVSSQTKRDNNKNLRRTNGKYSDIPTESKQFQYFSFPKTHNSEALYLQHSISFVVIETLKTMDFNVCIWEGVFDKVFVVQKHHFPEARSGKLHHGIVYEGPLVNRFELVWLKGLMFVARRNSLKAWTDSILLGSLILKRALLWRHVCWE